MNRFEIKLFYLLHVKIFPFKNIVALELMFCNTKFIANNSKGRVYLISSDFVDWLGNDVNVYGYIETEENNELNDKGQKACYNKFIKSEYSLPRE